MARLFADENFPLPVVEALRELGHEVLTTQQVGLAERAAPDAEVLEYAGSHGLALLTLNRKHFIRLHGADTRYHRIIVCRFDPDFAGQAARIDALLQAEAPLGGKLLRVNRPSG